MKIIVAPQAFKECASAESVAIAIAKGVQRVLPDATIIISPIADGGDGTLSLLIKARKGRVYSGTFANSLGILSESSWGVLPGIKGSDEPDIAVIEQARICGLADLPLNERNPLVTTTYGLGEAIIQTLDFGFRRLFIGLGGSATNDCGTGMAKALGAKFLDANGRELPLGAIFLKQLARIDISEVDPRIKETDIVAGCDVDNPLLGKNGASLTYAGQKGATPEMINELEDAMEHLSKIILRDLGSDIRVLTHGGAAGGTGAGLYAFANAKLVSGADWVLKETGFAEHLKGADLVIVGEGKLDTQTSYDKAPFAAAKLARTHNIPVLAIVGAIETFAASDRLKEFDAIIPLAFTPLTYPPSNSLELIAKASEEALRCICIGLHQNRMFLHR